jgi:hypothetical protein
MQDRPTAEQLIEAVASFLRDRVVPATQGPLAFHARVAANALDIARRELTLATEAEVRERTALSALLQADPHCDLPQLNRMLCERIVRDELDAQTPGLAEALWCITLDKLAIDQPGYETYQRALDRRASG